jgi:SAM-dependent methyltransferase
MNASAASQYDEVRYLRAKRSVDDRALNRGVLEAFEDAVRRLAQPVRVLELGAGIGTMVPRLMDRGQVTAARYTLVDRDRRSLGAAAEQLGSLSGTGVELDFVESDVFPWLEACAEPPFDVVIASAFLDLVDVRALLPLVWRRLRPGAPFWFSINFDGETIFVPELAADSDVLARYHRTMDDRVRDGRRAGESRTGRHLLESIPASGARIAAAGGSDWVVWPDDGRYPGDEAYFLHHIVHTIDEALAGAASLDPAALASWIAARHAQIDRAELSYVAHQLDIAGHAPASA